LEGIATNRIWANLRTNMSRAHKPGQKTFTKLNPWLNVVSVRDSTWSYQVRQTYPGLTVCASVHTSFFHYMPTWFVSWSKKCSRTLFLCDWTAFWRDEKSQTHIDVWYDVNKMVDNEGTKSRPWLRNPCQSTQLRHDLG
jgi:hypothetical protein